MDADDPGTGGGSNAAANVDNPSTPDHTPVTDEQVKEATVPGPVPGANVATDSVADNRVSGVAAEETAPPSEKRPPGGRKRDVDDDDDEEVDDDDDDDDDDVTTPSQQIEVFNPYLKPEENLVEDTLYKCAEPPIVSQCRSALYGLFKTHFQHEFGTCISLFFLFIRSFIDVDYPLQMT